MVRVTQRVAGGKHAAPEEKIRSRIPRTYTNLTKVISFCDEVSIFDIFDVVSVTNNEGKGTEIEPDFKLQAIKVMGHLVLQ